MTKLDTLQQKVAELYNSKNDGRADWADWLYGNHVLIVANYAKELAPKYEADSELAHAAALLHDIADYKMKRGNPAHEEESLKIAREIMEECGYSEEEVKLVVDDAIRFHSCHDGERPQSQEGLVLATADTLAHLKTDFYIFATWALAKQFTLDEVKAWVLKKLDRDLNNKISFDDIREDARPDYERLKTLYSR